MQREAEAVQKIERLVEGKEGECQPGRKKRNKADGNHRKETAEGTQQHSREDGRRKRGEAGRKEEKRKIKVAGEQRRGVEGVWMAR